MFYLCGEARDRLLKVCEDNRSGKKFFYINYLNYKHHQGESANLPLF